MRKINNNCHNCGAPVEGVGRVRCQFCGTEYFADYGIDQPLISSTVNWYPNNSFYTSAQNEYYSSYPQGRRREEPRHKAGKEDDVILPLIPLLCAL